MKVSIIIPVYNEEESIPELYRELRAVFDREPWDAEIIMVDDGSADDSARIIAAFADRDPRVRLVRFARNFGQTAAILAGIDHATGDVLIPMDADLQNDPEDIPRLLSKLEEGYDVVSGWRKNRQDRFWSRRLPSILANRLISWWTGVALNDYGCTLKAYRATALKGEQLYGEMHRFIPIYASWRGGRITELVVNHRARQFGSSKYGLGRTFKVLLDLMTVKFLSGYSTKPAYLFGGIGITLLGVGVVLASISVLEWLIWNTWPHKMTVMMLATFFVTNGVALLCIGLLAELVVRIYHGQGHRKTYVLAADLRPEEAPAEAPMPRP
ncbi:MAG TPA: glycosyltransferase family 2 protein [Polyangiales bacterium]|nr:glycosyltransferase family 2 protein [Polyangiales bacterium]